MPESAGSTGSDDRTCVECGEEKPLHEFFARHARCRVHKQLRHGCRTCEHVKNGTFRQPRCKDCDRARGARVRCIKRLRDELEDYGFDESVLRASESDTIAVVQGLSRVPPGLRASLRQIAGSVIELRWSFERATTAMSLFARTMPQIVDRPPRGSRTYAPIHDLTASAGRFGEGMLPERLGYIDTLSRTRTNDFVGAVHGPSMEPTIPSDSLALFRHETSGDHLNGRVVLAQHRGVGDEDAGGEYVVKRLHWDEDGIQLASAPIFADP